MYLSKFFNLTFSIAILLNLSFLFNTAYAQVAEGQLLAQWSDSTLVGSFSYDNTYNEVWGLSVNDHEYAIIGSTEGTHFIDVTDTEAIKESFRVLGGTTGGQIIHRDYHDHNGFLYAVSDEGSNSTLQIMDISNLPDTVTVVYDSKEYIRRSHNIFIDESQDIMYSCISQGTSLSFAALRLFDISDPYNPMPIKAYNSIEGVFMSQVHDAYVKDNIAYLNNGPDGMMIVDFTDTESPILIANLTSSEYPDAGYNHSGYVSEDGNYYYMADENHGADIKVIDVSNPMDLEVVNTFNADNDSPNTIPHNQLVHDDLLYVSYYYDGLQVYDISDPSTPVRVMEYKTSKIANRSSYEGAWGVYPFLPSGNILVSDMQEGLFVIKGIQSLSSTYDQNLSDLFRIYPNPTSDFVYLDFDKNTSARIEITNTNGQLILTRNIQNNTEKIDIRHLPNGHYIVSLVSDNKLASKSLVVVK